MYELTYFMSTERLCALIDSIYNLTGIPTGIFNTQGLPVAAAGWEKTSTQSLGESSLARIKDLVKNGLISLISQEEKEYIIYKCESGMVYIGFPVVARNGLLAVIFQGQFLIEETDLNRFKRSAVEIETGGQCLPEPLNLEVSKEVPVIPGEKVDLSIELILQISKLIIEVVEQRLTNQQLTNEIEIIKANSNRIEKELKESYEELSAVYEELMASEEELRQQFDELQQSQEALRKSEERYKIAVDGANDGIWDWDLENDVSYISEKWAKMLGFDHAEIKGHYEKWGSIIHPDDLVNVRNTLKEHFKGLTPYYECEYRLRKKDGEYIWILSRGKALKDADGRLVRMAGSHTDITERKRTEELIFNMAFFDALTNLPNRTQFLARLNDELLRAADSRSSGALFYIDIDNFKSINDTLGHSFGDVFLIKVAERLSSFVSEDALVARFGGDEFIILLPEISGVDEAISFADKLIKEFRGSWSINGYDLFPTISVGVTIYPRDGDNIGELLKNADMAMYKAKEVGKNNYQFYDPSMLERIIERSEMEKFLHQAIINNEFILDYQPQFDIKKHKIVGLEALVRWLHPTKGLIPPSTFISLAEETGLINEIGRWVIETACREVKDLHNNGFEGLTVSINISSVQLQNERFVDLVKDILERTGLEPQYLEFEITESVMIDNFDINNSILNKLKQLGIRISLDDFGTGYSSLNYIKRMPLSTLKIDKSFIADIEKDTTQKFIIEAIIRLAHKIGLDVTAEGVESVNQLKYLKELQCDRIQGFLVSKPEPAEQLVEMLENIDKLRDNFTI
ncbi:MAG TPA: EAL domain-containing protein [Clostridiaceae bacterium]|nr:EAL domain-containing protein [Clostridiaceae bacterium]